MEKSLLDLLCYTPLDTTRCNMVVYYRHPLFWLISCNIEQCKKSKQFIGLTHLLLSKE